MATNGKDTIYIDIDDEITAIIEKVRASNDKIVALVLPKRASVLQSIVNMKLLKRTGDQEKKRIVLITAEAGLLPLAGSVGLHVAKSLQTKPEIPHIAGLNDDDEDVIEEPDEALDMTDVSNDDDEITAATDGDKAVGTLAAAKPLPVAPEAIETLQLDDDEEDIPDDVLPAGDTDKDSGKKKDKPKKPKKNKKLGVPNFDRFRKILMLGGVLLVALIVFLYFAITVLPKASLVITTDTTTVNSNVSLTADTTAKTLNTSNGTLPAQVQKVDKTGSQQVPTTGKKNNGTTATGKVTLSLSDCSTSQVTVPAGTGLSANGLTFVTQADANLQSVKVGASCKNNQFPDFSTATVNVTAQAPGAQYNIAASTFKVSGYSSVAASSSNAMSGGTDNIIQIVAQSDIDSATQKITAQNSDSVKQQLEQQLKQASMYPIIATFVAGSPNTQTSAQVGDQVGTVTVTQTTTYTMFGVKEADLKTLVDNDVKTKIDTSKQAISNEGLDKATFKVNTASTSSAQILMQTSVIAGPDLKADDIKSEVAGKKAGQIQDMLKADPGVTSVDVHLSPFWVTSVPHKANKVTVTFEKSQ